MSEIDVHPSISDLSFEREVVDSLRNRRLNPKLLYVTPRQTELWRKVFLKHSPIQGNPEFARIYRDAFARIVDELPPGKIWLVGLGCGTGLKEAELCMQLKARGREVEFSAVDISRDLVTESVKKVEGAGASHQRSLICDLKETAFLAEWLERGTKDIPRLYTFFGLVPNMAPSVVARLFRAVLRPGDVLLASAHLAPVGEGVDLSAAMRKVRPQYDNPETLAWLKAAMVEYGLSDQLDEPVMTVGESEGIPAFRGLAMWKSDEPFATDFDVIDPDAEHPLELFRSLRYTPELFKEFLRREGFRSERLAMTACREEAIWAVRR